jgi:hypothetical protein
MDTRAIPKNLLNMNGCTALNLKIRESLTFNILNALKAVSKEQKQIAESSIKPGPQDVFDFVSRNIDLIDKIMAVPHLLNSLSVSQNAIRRVTNNLNTTAIDMAPSNLEGFIKTKREECYLIKLWEKFPTIRTEAMLQHIAMEEHKDELTAKYPLYKGATNRYRLSESMTTTMTNEYKDSVTACQYTIPRFGM